VFLKKLYFAILLSCIVGVLAAQINDSIVTYGPYELWEAADNGDLGTVIECLDQGIYVDISDDNGITALMLASQSGHLNVVEYLAINNANINAKPKFPGTPPLIAAARNNHVDVVEYLIRHNAEIDAKDDYGRQAIHYTANYGYYILTDMLIYYEADCDEPDNYGRTPLYYAIINAQTEIAKLLVANNADILKIDSNGNSYLHLAADIDTITLIDYMLESNIPYNLTNNNNMSILDLAVYYGNYYLVERLIEKGAIPNDTITEYFNTRTLANNSGNRKIKKLIKNQGIKNIHKPYFQYIDLVWDLSFNAKDFQMGFHTGLYDTRYGIKIIVGGLFRTGKKWVNLYDGNNVYLQLKESRWSIYTGLRKYIRFLKNGNNTFLLFAGVNELYSNPSYEAINNREAASVITLPEAGLCINFKRFVNIEFTYKYCNFNIENISPHRMGISLIFGFNYKPNEINEQNKYIIRE
jgi:ankyrin repeat protein